MYGFGDCPAELLNQPLRNGVPLNFVRSKAGHRDFGQITALQAAHIRRPAAPIWLPKGIAGSRGFGNLHCQQNASRMKQINEFGFTFFSDFCEFVALEFSSIRDARRADLAVVRRHKSFDFHLIIRYRSDDDGARWDIITGVPSRVCRDTELWRCETAGG